MAAGDAAPMTFIYIGDDGTFREVRLTDTDTADMLVALQTLVNGLIQPASTSLPVPVGAPTRRGVELWLNEEGKLRNDLAANPHAVALLDYPTSDMFIGPVVIADSDREGYTVGLDAEVVEAAKAHLAALGARELAPCDVATAAAQQDAVRQERLAAGYPGHGYEPYARVVSLGPNGEILIVGADVGMDI